MTPAAGMNKRGLKNDPVFSSTSRNFFFLSSSLEYCNLDDDELVPSFPGSWLCILDTSDGTGVMKAYVVASKPADIKKKVFVNGGGIM